MFVISHLGVMAMQPCKCYGFMLLGAENAFPIVSYWLEVAIYLAESEHDTSLPIMGNYDKSSILAMFIMIYHCLQWSIMEDNDLQCVAF